jgi:hypothetical protein
MSHMQEQGRAPDVARLIHLKRQRMVRDRLRQEEHTGHHGIGFDIYHRKAGDQRHYSIVERLDVEARNGIEAGGRIQVVVI